MHLLPCVMGVARAVLCCQDDMGRFLGIVSAVLALFVAGTAAGEEAANGVPAPDQPPAPAACLIGAHSAELNDAARAATTLVCDALRARGVAVGPAVDDGAGTSATYSVKLDKLDSGFSLTVTYQELGTVRQMRAMSVRDLSELVTAASELVTALTPDKRVEAVQPLATLPVSAATLVVRPVITKDDTIPKRDLRLTFYLGDFFGQQDGLMYGASLRYRAGPFVGGALFESGEELFGSGYSYEGAAALGGLGLRPLRRVRVELLLELGGHFHSGVGKDSLNSRDPGATGQTAYAGGRASLGYIFGRSRDAHFELGAYACFQDDLGRRRVQFQYGYVPPQVGSHVIGDARGAYGLELGATFDLF